VVVSTYGELEVLKEAEWEMEAPWPHVTVEGRGSLVLDTVGNSVH
jgi:hypothetical protein